MGTWLATLLHKALRLSSPSLTLFFRDSFGPLCSPVEQSFQFSRPYPKASRVLLFLQNRLSLPPGGQLQYSHSLYQMHSSRACGSPSRGSVSCPQSSLIPGLLGLPRWSSCFRTRAPETPEMKLCTASSSAMGCWPALLLGLATGNDQNYKQRRVGTQEEESSVLVHCVSFN